jgi:pimeloyl-ACP methyl ester carboxylesterase
MRFPEERLDDLRRRLATARLPAAAIRGGGETPETVARLDELIAYWRDGYDWSAQADRIAALPHRFVTVDGVRLHAIVAEGKTGTGAGPRPLLLVNGWPSSFVEYLDVLGPLTDPAAHGGDPADAFTVVIPALPGYGLSDRALHLDLDREAIARLFDRLMVHHLGFDSYVAHGDDIGGGVVNRLGIHHADTVTAIQTANWLDAHVPPGAALTGAEERYLAASREWDRTEGAYAHVQQTRPHTLAFALTDSPVGLAAWILEKWLTWSDPASTPSADLMLTNVMLYWLTDTIASSTRLYALSSPPGPRDVIQVPASVLVPNEPRLPVPPEEWLRRAYPQLTRVAHVGTGGHFLAAEQPSLFVNEIRNAFR